MLSVTVETGSLFFIISAGNVTIMVFCFPTCRKRKGKTLICDESFYSEDSGNIQLTSDHLFRVFVL